MAEVYSSAGHEAARLVSKSPAMAAATAPIAAKARARARARGDEAFAGSVRDVPVKGKSGITDRIVEATDPLSLPKEFGHVIRNEADGPVIGYAQPLRYMRGAFAATPAVPGD